MSDHDQDHLKLYYKIGGALLFLTVVTVAISYIDFAVPVAIAVALIVATVKGSLVASYFMHLIGERKSIYATLALTVFFFAMLIFIPLLGHSNTSGEHKAFPNSHPPVMGGSAH